MGERCVGQLVEARARDGGDLQRGLERLALDVQLRVVARTGRVPPAPAAAAGARPSSRTRSHDHRDVLPATQPASRRAYSSRRSSRLIRATSGTVRCSAATRPSAVSRSWSLSPARIANSNSGSRRATRSRTAVSPRLSQVAGVLPVRRDGDERLRGEALLALERLLRGGLTGRVAVEGVDDLAAVERVVADQPPDHRHVLGAERRATRRDGRLHAGQVHRHHVGVALDDDDLAALRDLALRQVQPEQHVRLAVDRRLGRVEVLGVDAVVVEQPARAEADDVAPEVADRPQQAAVEPVDRAAPALLARRPP